MTIPKALRDQLGIVPGSELDFDAEEGRLVARKARPDDPIAAVYGVLATPGGTDRLIEQLRGKPDAT